MNLTLVSRAMRYGSLVIVLVAWEASAPADVITTGDVDPGGTGTQPDPWTFRSDFIVGNEGTGTLNVSDGGEVSNTYSYLGNSFSSIGEVTVTGTGSQWSNSGWLSVASSGSGTLNVTDGGVVSNVYSYIGYHSGSTGMTTVSGSGSRLNDSENLSVGHKGNGTLNVTDGGAVSREHYAPIAAGRRLRAGTGPEIATR